MERERLISEREEIMATLDKRDRRILYYYEKEFGRVFPGAIYKVIHDQKDNAAERHAKKKKRK